jgi:hypothetical protein
MLVRAVAAFIVVMIGTGHALADDVIDGRFGPGALYRLVRPANWNGNLVLYAHGYPGKPVTDRKYCGYIAAMWKALSPPLEAPAICSFPPSIL